MREFRTSDEIGAFIRSLRKERGLTQTDIGKVLGLEKTAVSKIESGARALTAKELIWLADYFTLSSKEIACREPEGAFLRAGEADPEGIRRSLDCFRECIEDYLGLEALLG
jgi:transcriptional regulator with XRE-family HTH domain